MKSQLPVFNRESKQAKLVDDLPSLLPVISAKYGIPISDFSNVKIEVLRKIDFNKIKKIKDINYNLITQFIDEDCSRLLRLLPHEALFTVKTSSIPVPQLDIMKYLQDFESLYPINSTVSGDVLKKHLIAISGLSSGSLYKIWKLSDINGDGKLTIKEYSICRDLIEMVKYGGDVPAELPAIFR